MWPPGPPSSTAAARRRLLRTGGGLAPVSYVLPAFASFILALGGGGGPPWPPPPGVLVIRLKPCDPRSRSSARALVVSCGGLCFFGVPFFGSRGPGGPGWALRRPGPGRPRGSPPRWSLVARAQAPAVGARTSSSERSRRPPPGPGVRFLAHSRGPHPRGGIGSPAPWLRRRRSDRSSEPSRRPLLGLACGPPRFLFGPPSFLVQAPQW